jgi:coenzyme PQQ synthesis protein D (PqqD)
MSGLHSVFAPAADVVVRDLDGEAVVLDLATGTYFGLNDIGTRIWQLVAQQKTLIEVVAVLEHEFDAPVDRLEADLRDFVDRLVAKGLLRPVQIPTDVK